MQREEEMAIAYKLLLMHGLERTYARLKFFGSYFGQILPGKGIGHWAVKMCRTLHFKHNGCFTVGVAPSQIS